MKSNHYQVAKEVLNKFSELLIFVIPLVTFLGWLTGNYQLTSWFNNHVPMQFNAAVCALVMSFFVVYVKHFKYTRYLLMVSFAIAHVTLWQDLISIDFGIDEFVIIHSYAVNTPHPGRMAPMTSFAFQLIALIEFIKLKKPAWFLLITTVPPLAGHLIKVIYGVQVTWLLTVPFTDTTFMAMSTVFFFNLYLFNILTRGNG